jgi:hypothetical protein
MVKRRIAVVGSGDPVWTWYMDPFTTIFESEHAAEGQRTFWMEDPFEACMPKVDAVPESAEPFVIARAEVARGGADKDLASGQHCIGIVTPGRQVLFLPTPKPGRVTSREVLQACSVLPSDKPLNVTAIAFTSLEPLLRDPHRCIPFLRQLLALGHAGHNVIVFEGHESAFEYGLRGTQALLVDSAMLPFLSPNWWDLAMRTIRDRMRILVYDRRSRTIRPVRPE